MALKDRPAGEVLLFMVTGTVCFVILISTISVAIIEIINPKTDTSRTVSALSDVINTLIGVLAGYLAGRSDKGPKNEL